MHFALAPDHHLVRFGIVHDGQRGVFLGELGERGAELDVVLAFLGLHRGGEHRRHGLHLDERGMRLLAGRQRVAGLGMVELAEGDRVAGDGLRALLEVLAHQLEDRRTTRPASLRACSNVVPSPAWPESMRAIDILPPCAVWKVFITKRHGVVAGFDAETFGGRVDAGRFMAQRLHQAQHAVERVAMPISTGQTRPSRNSLARSSNTWSRGGWMSSSSCAISSSS